MAEVLYLPYLLLLLLVPVLVLWRRGLIAALTMTVLELGFIAAVFWVMNEYRLFPSPYIGEPPPQGTLEEAKRLQAASSALLLIWAIAPAQAALAGAAVSILLAALRGLWRARAQRSEPF